MAADEIKSLKNRIRGLKTQITNFDKFIGSLDENKISDNEVFNINQRLTIITTVIDTFYEAQIKLEALDENNLDQLIANREGFENQYFLATSKAQSILNKIESNQTPEPRSVASNGVSGHSGVNLPKINLPTFDGTATLWVEFYDAFSAMVHSNNQLTNCQKLCYLRSSLKGEALSTLKSLQTTNENYSIAWNALETRYNNERKIIEMHVSNLLNIEPIAKENPTILRNFIDTVENTINCLSALKQPTDNWDALLVPILVNKLNLSLIKEWECKINDDANNVQLIKYKELIKFLNTKHAILQSIFDRNILFDTKRPIAKSEFQSKFKPSVTQTRTFVTTPASCSFCQGNHFPQYCREFLKLNISDRRERVKHAKLCFNCFRANHSIKDCQSKSTCKVCAGRHHTTLHCSNPVTNVSQENLRNTNANVEHVENLPSTSNDRSSTVTLSTANKRNHFSTPNYVLLSTAQVFVHNKSREKHRVRILLDSASQSNYITESVCKKLSLKTEPTSMCITGINQSLKRIFEKTMVQINSRFNNYSANISCLVLDRITDTLPTVNLNLEKISIPSNISLADETFNQPGEIDMLIGAELFWSLLGVGQIKNPDGTIFQKTKLGWIVSGGINLLNMQNQVVQSYITVNQLHNELKRFWKIDEFDNNEKFLTVDEEYCEKHFKDNVSRSADGRFVVKIPLKTNLQKLGDSFNEAKSRFFSLERKFKFNQSLKVQYSKCLNDYIQNNHASVSEDSENSFYLPHHAVVKESSETTKLRVVFDGSCRLPKGLSINQVQYVGPTIQNDLLTILTRFRTHQYVITADVKQMYRQILIHPNHRKYQKFLWRESSNDDLKSYELNTVTFGLSASPFLAIRCLIELASLNTKNFPVESQKIKDDFYVDDLLTGANSITELNSIKSNIVSILKQAKFVLTKFKSNVSELNEANNDYQIDKTSECKVLGMSWNSKLDQFFYSVSNSKEPGLKVCKRTILSLTAQLFDPLGLLTPIIIIPKLIIQQLWKLELNWDESVPLEIHTEWIKFRNDLTNINHIKVPRWVFDQNVVSFELHGFSDASEKAYGACVYIKSIDKFSKVKIHLLGSKSRVAPLKNLSLPRLELCAAVLLTNLLEKFESILNIKWSKKCLWTDSQIVLSWIKAHPSKWTTFVANRVSYIQSITTNLDWYHVKSLDNPADLISRGTLASNLIHRDLWWKGPTWLNDTNHYIAYQENLIQIPEQKKQSALVSLPSQEQNPFLNKYSNFDQLIRVIALCLRFKHNLVHKNDKRVGIIIGSEKNTALIRVVSLIQTQYFHEELESLSRGKPLSSKSKILNLSPFIDNDGIIRVGGRLKQSNLAFNNKHPMLLPHDAQVTKLIMQKVHNDNLHVGPTQIVCLTRQKFWPIRAQSLAKMIVRKCMKCFRFNQKPVYPIMGNLPDKRVNIASPFQTTGVDYCGPFLIKDRQTRNAKLIKCYVCVFVCFAIKAIHLELVTSLTTEAFLAMFRRFVSRRGKPLDIYSDNGTNFRGAEGELKCLRNFLAENASKIQENNISQDINWHFIPSRSPHFGGLWEAGVKSVKYHLKRTLSNTSLNYEEFCTVLYQIEAILNSRPLTPMSHDPNDLHVLTPAHFLIGHMFTSLPDPDMLKVPENRLGRYQYLQRLNQQFWKRWSVEYLSNMQQRSKWKNGSQATIQNGDLVLLREDDAPPCNWKIARIIDLHPGNDNVVRVVSVKCSNGSIFKRPVVKLCFLPNDD